MHQHHDQRSATRVPHGIGAVPEADTGIRSTDPLLHAAEASPVFQPIVEASSGRLVGIEALSRPRQSSGFASIGDLLDAATRTGRRTETELALAANALSAASQHAAQATVFLNASSAVFCHSGFYGMLASARAPQTLDHPLELAVELTEEGGDPGIDELASAAARLRELGVAIAIDDVGAGAEDLVRASTLLPDWLKLDRRLTAAVEFDAGQRALVSGMLRFADGIGARLVAEGVERANQLDTLTTLGVRWVQGFGIARPAALNAGHSHPLKLPPPLDSAA